MTLLQRINAAFAALFNRYEAGQRWSTKRSYLPGYVQDARFDIDNATREEIIRNARWCEKNSWIMQRLIHLYEQFVVGSNGLAIISDSSNPVWNESADTAFAASSRFADESSLCGLATLEAIAACTWFVDGEVFILKTRGQELPRRPRIQLIECHRVATPGNYTGSAKVIDGIEVDSRGRRVAYWMRTGFDDENFRRVPADQVIHLFEPSRPGQMRGVPLSYSVLNLIRDLFDLEALEMDAAKDAAVKSTIIFTANGELDNTAEGMRRERYGQPTQDSSGTDTTANQTRYIKNEIGGRVAAMKVGEEVTQFKPERPTQSQQAHWEYLIGAICNGHGLPKSLVWAGADKMQGTQMRSDLQLANAFFKSRASLLADAFIEVRNYFIGWEIQNNQDVADSLPADWYKVVVLPPSAVNVDTGYNASAMIAELEAGTITFRDVFAPRGQYWKKQLRQSAVEAQEIRRLAEEFGIEAGEISAIAKEGMIRPQQPMQLAAPAPEDDEEDPEEDDTGDDAEEDMTPAEPAKA